MKDMKAQKGRFIDERGTSMVELIAIMAILAILLGASGNALGYLNGKEAQQCAYKTEAVLSEIRMETMSKSSGEKESVYARLQKDGDQITVIRKIWEEEKKDRIGKNVVVTVKEIGGNEWKLEDGDGVNIYFQRSTGALYDDAGNICQIKVSQGRNSFVVKIEPTTGKISYERE